MDWRRFIAKAGAPLKRISARTWFGPSIGGGLAIMAGLLLLFLKFDKQEVPLGQHLIHLSYDLQFFFRRDLKADEAVIVFMDEESHQELGQHYSQPWDRRLHARLLQRLKAEGATVVTLDTLFTEPAPPIANKALSDAMKAHGRVVMGADYLSIGGEGTGSGYRISYSSDFRDAAASGLVSLLEDPDQGVRQQFEDPTNPSLHLAGAYDGETFVPTLSWRTAQLAGASAVRAANTQPQERWINYYGPAGHLPHVSYYAALKTNGSAPGTFRGKTVFVGELPPLTAMPGALKEEYRTPYTFWTKRFSSGVEIQATMFLNLIRNDWLRHISGFSEFLIVLIVGGAVGFGLASLRPVAAAAAAAGSVLLITGIAIFLFRRQHIWFAWLIPAVVQTPLAFAWSIAYNSVKLHIEKRLLSRTLELHLSPQRVTQILKRPDLLRPGAEKQEISILFSDIANFSKVTARMDADDLFRLLNRYFQESLSCIHETDGTVVKLIGDAIFAIWNAPFPQADQQARACRAAMLLQARLVQFDSASQALPLRTRVGLHTGIACVGNVGSIERFDYTAIGDSVNLASRLEGLNKILGTNVLATRDIQKTVEKSFISRRVGYFRFKGMDRIVEVFEMIGERKDAVEDEEYCRIFEKALHRFHRKDFSAAESGFSEVSQLRPTDGPTKFYLSKIREFQDSPRPDDWAGEILLS
jgi:adenylate cyclase